MDENLANALAIAAYFFEEKANFIERININSPYCLPRSSGARNDDAIRIKVMALAKINQLIFDESMYQTLAAMAVSLLGGKKRVSKATVKGWCERVSISE